MLRLSIALCAVALALPIPDAAGGQPIPSEFCRGLWIVPLTYDDGRVRLDLLLDTGASRTAIDPDALERVLGRRVRPGRSATLRDGRIGPLRLRRIRAVSHELDHLGRALGRPFDGILGFDTFHDLLLTLDYPKREIRIGRGRLDDADAATVVLRDHGKRRPWVELSLGETRVAVLVDSGFTGGLTLREQDVKRWSSPPRPVGGSVRYETIAVKPAGRAALDASFGPFVIERPLIDVSTGTRLLGAESMAGLSLTFDHRSRSIGVRAASDEPIRHEAMRGLGVVFRPRPAGLELARVFDELPAQRAGLRVGDVVTAYDGVPVYERGCELTARTHDAERINLSVMREGEPLEFDVEVGVLVP